jgi:hypothetical protein
VTVGSVGNLPAGTVCTWVNAPIGADPTFVLTSPLDNGLDIESNSAVMARIQQRLQNPPRGGNSTDIIDWAEEVASIVGVFVYPRRSGTSGVDVVITVGGSGVGRVPSSTLQNSVNAIVNSLRAAGAEQFNILLPFTAVSGHLIRVRVIPNGTANAFDWGGDVTWTGTPFTVAGHTTGPPGTITLNTTAPASLQSAIASFIAGNGTKPRLQVMSTGSVINPPIGVVAIDVTNTILTLDTIPSTWVVPTNGDVIFPYGPVVATIATNELALVDGLGPSRQSGYGDAFNTWFDILTIGQLTRVAEDAVDATGAALITEVIDGGATIDGVATSIEAGDATPNNPELLYAKSIAVTP